MVRWSFERAGFRLNPSDLLGAVTVDLTPVLEHIDVPGLPFDHAFRYPERLRPEQLQRSERGSDSGFQGRRSLQSISLHMLRR
jgi:hypothetical protein